MNHRPSFALLSFHTSRLRSSRLGMAPFLGRLAAITSLGLLSAPALAQVPPPPMPPPEQDEPETSDSAFESDTSSSEAEESTDAESEPQAPSPTEEAPPEERAQEPSGEAAAAASMTLTPDEAEAADAEEEDLETWFRGVSLRRQTTITGSTGLHRVREAGSGEAGTFRINFHGGYFSKKAFLCTDSAVCSDPVTGAPLGEDKASKTEAIASISVTPFSFLEAYLSVHNSATSNTNGSPQLLQVVGDANIGIKAFSPAKQDQLFYYGGDLDLYLLTGTGGVGVAGGATSVALHGLLTMDLNNRTKVEDRIPLRAHLNLGYFFDNSGNVVKDLENTAPPAGRGAPIERTERYGLGLSRVDAFEIGLGTEYIHDYFRPFLEWTLDIPVNRQGYICNVQGAESRGDECLGLAAGFSTSPSRLTLGTRVMPWQASGLSITAALDLGTGGTKRFLEETTPEAPYSLWLGVGYAVDTVPPKPVEVAAPPTALVPETRRYVLGRVVEETSGAAIPDAIIRYEGVPMTGLVANAEGEFISQDLPAGQYTFSIYAEEFRPGTCTISIPESAPPQSVSGDATAEESAALDPAAPVDPNQDPTLATQEPAVSDALAPFADADGNVLVPADCKLKELPRIANITGLLVDATSGGPVPDATVTITDKLNRSLKLEVDDQGSFQFRNVPFGEARLTATAPGYMTMISPVVIDSREELKPHLLMNARPGKLDLTVGKNEIALGRSIQFVGDTPEVAVDSMSMLEELAVALKENAEIDNIEIQVHTDDTGAASYSRRISQQRANRIKDILVQLGVREARLEAKGYGPDQPLAPNVSDANRARNKRVQIILQQPSLGGRR